MRKLGENFCGTKGLLFALVGVNWLTFMLAPGTVSDTFWKWLVNLHWVNGGAWYSIMVVFIFNCSDTLGRYPGGMKIFELGIVAIHIGVVARLFFWAFMLLVDFEVPPTWLFGADWFKMLNLAMFAFTNGYFGTLCAVKAPMTMKESRRPQVGAYISACINLGILLGVTSELATRKYLKVSPCYKRNCQIPQ